MIKWFACEGSIAISSAGLTCCHSAGGVQKVGNNTACATHPLPCMFPWVSHSRRSFLVRKYFSPCNRQREDTQPRSAPGVWTRVPSCVESEPSGPIAGNPCPPTAGPAGRAGPGRGVAGGRVLHGPAPPPLLALLRPRPAPPRLRPPGSCSARAERERHPRRRWRRGGGMGRS